MRRLDRKSFDLNIKSKVRAGKRRVLQTLVSKAGSAVSRQLSLQGPKDWVKVVAEGAQEEIRHPRALGLALLRRGEASAMTISLASNETKTLSRLKRSATRVDNCILPAPLQAKGICTHS